FVAGPFEVHVTGTKLTITWDPDSERIDVALHEGSVEIETPIGPSHYAVTAGHTFHACARDGVVKLDDGKKHEPALQREALQPEPVATADPVAAGTTRARDATEMKVHGRDTVNTEAPLRARDTAATDVAPKASETPESWPKQVRRGAFAEVVAAAR